MCSIHVLGGIRRTDEGLQSQQFVTSHFEILDFLPRLRTIEL